MGETKQVNIEIPETLARAIKSDAAALGITLNEYGRTAFEAFISKKAAARKVLFEGAKRKILGRKLAA